MNANNEADELLWDNHIEEDLGDLLDLIIKNSLSSTRDILNHETNEVSKKMSEMESSLTDKSLSIEELEFIPKHNNISLLRRIEAFVKLLPGFPCSEIIPDNVELSEIIHRQLIMDEIRAKLDNATVRVYSRRHSRNAANRRVSGPSFIVPRRRGIELPSTYLALIEKMNPILFNQIHDGDVNQLPISPDDIHYLNRLGQFIDIFERVTVSDAIHYDNEEGYVLQMEYDRVYDLLFTKTTSMTISGDDQAA